MGVFALNHTLASLRSVMFLTVSSHPFSEFLSVFSNIFEWLQVNSRKKSRRKVQIALLLSVVSVRMETPHNISLYHLKTKITSSAAS